MVLCKLKAIMIRKQGVRSTQMDFSTCVVLRWYYGVRVNSDKTEFFFKCVVLQLNGIKA